MRFHRFARLAIAVGAFLSPAIARAQCTFQCPAWFRHVIPADGEEIPSNLPRLALPVPLWGPANLYREDGGAVSYTYDAGDDGRWLIPSELEPGERYFLRLSRDTCDTARYGEWDAGYVIESWTGAPVVPLPTELGTVSVELPEAGYIPINTGSGGGACGPPFIPGQFFRLNIAPSESLKPWLAVTSWSVFVDGQRQSSNLDPGALLADGGVVPLLGPDTDVPRSPFTAEFACGAPGYHRVQLLAHVIGTNVTLATEVMTLFVDCPDVESDGGAGPLNGIPRNEDRACGCAAGDGFALMGAAAAIALSVRRFTGKSRGTSRAVPVR